MENFQNRDTKWLEYLFGAIVVITLIFIVIILGGQGIAWLETGTIPPHDLYWFTADGNCAGGGGGWEGKNNCRPDYIFFSDWVGVDKIVNLIMDMNVAVVALIVAFILSNIIWHDIAIIERENTEKAMRRREKEATE